MLIILSPAKIQNFKPQSVTREYTLPIHMQEASTLIQELLPLSVKELEKLLKVNPDIAWSAYGSYQNWSASPHLQSAKQAIFAYNGEVYRGLNAKDFSTEDLNYAQKHLRIISGLYGVLRPLDLIQPYRLEMNTKLQNERGENLYTFWKENISKTIFQAVKESEKPEIILNLASKEYSKAINIKKSNVPVIDFDFLENRHEAYKPIVIYTKKARGLMARYIIRNKINNIEDIKKFDTEGYEFNSRYSSENKIVFTRG